MPVNSYLNRLPSPQSQMLSPAPYNRTVLNTENHTVRRIVSLQPSATVTLRDLGLLDRVVACTKYCVDVCPEVGDGSRVIVADSWTAQAEQILAARPDLVVASVPYQTEARSRKF